MYRSPPLTLPRIRVLERLRALRDVALDELQTQPVLRDDLLREPRDSRTGVDALHRAHELRRDVRLREVQDRAHRLLWDIVGHTPDAVGVVHGRRALCLAHDEDVAPEGPEVRLVRAGQPADEDLRTALAQVDERLLVRLGDHLGDGHPVLSEYRADDGSYDLWACQRCTFDAMCQAGGTMVELERTWWNVRSITPWETVSDSGMAAAILGAGKGVRAS